MITGQKFVLNLLKNNKKELDKRNSKCYNKTIENNSKDEKKEVDYL